MFSKLECIVFTTRTSQENYLIKCKRMVYKGEAKRERVHFQHYVKIIDSISCWKKFWNISKCVDGILVVAKIEGNSTNSHASPASLKRPYSVYFCAVHFI